MAPSSPIAPETSVWQRTNISDISFTVFQYISHRITIGKILIVLQVYLLPASCGSTERLSRLGLFSSGLP